MGSDIPVQALQVDSVKAGMTEDIADQCFYSVGAIAFTPIVTVANDNTHFGFASALIDVVISAVANVLAVFSFYSKGESS